MGDLLDMGLCPEESLNRTVSFGDCRPGRIQPFLDLTPPQAPHHPGKSRILRILKRKHEERVEENEPTILTDGLLVDRMKYEPKWLKHPAKLPESDIAGVSLDHRRFDEKATDRMRTEQSLGSLKNGKLVPLGIDFEEIDPLDSSLPAELIQSHRFHPFGTPASRTALQRMKRRAIVKEDLTTAAGIAHRDLMEFEPPQALRFLPED
jgi:hypothetical protein